jgi:thiol-disulfide isomerase/thioredoxin
MAFASMPVTALANDTIRVVINDQQVEFRDQEPVIVDGRTLVPVRGVFETMGFEVGWDGNLQTAFLVRNDFQIAITIGSDVFTTNGTRYTLDVPAQIIGGRTMLPLRAVLESVGYTLDWDGSTRTVSITSGKSYAPTGNTFLFPFSFDAEDLQGNRVTQHSLGEKELYFVYYWTTGCWGCVEGLPDLARLANEFGSRVGFLSVLGDYSTERNRALQVTQDAGVPFITIDAMHPDLRNLMPLLDSGFVPTTVLIGADGRGIGNQMIGGDYNSYKQAIENALMQSPFSAIQIDIPTPTLMPTPAPTPTPVPQAQTATFPFRFNATDLHGNRVTEASLGEKELFFVHITATWCGPCDYAAPSIAAVSLEFGDRVGFISLLEDFNETGGRNGALQWSRNYGGNYIIVDQHLSAFRPIMNILESLPSREYDGQIFSGWGYPTSLLIDGRGNVIDMFMGGGDITHYRMLIEGALSQVNPAAQTRSSAAQPSAPLAQYSHVSGSIVLLCQVPEFKNHEMGAYQTNGLVADTIRHHIQRYSINHSNHAAETYNVTAKLQRESDALLQAILDVWDDDPATRIFGVNKEGMEARFSRVSMFPFTTNSNRLGFWHGQTHEGWFATHRIDENGRRVQIPIDEIVYTYLYELFGRGEGLGILLSYTIAEHLLGTGPLSNPCIWSHYTGFYHRLGEVVGLENIFAAARQGQQYFTNWMNEQIRVLNANFDFNYDTLMRAMLGAGAVKMYDSTASTFSRTTGVSINNLCQYFREAMDWFYTASNKNATATQRNNATRQFNGIIQQMNDFSRANNLAITWNYHCSCEIRCYPWFYQMPSVHDDNRPMFNLSDPARGVGTQLSLGCDCPNCV